MKENMSEKGMGPPKSTENVEQGLDALCFQVYQLDHYATML